MSYCTVVQDGLTMNKEVKSLTWTCVTTWYCTNWISSKWVGSLSFANKSAGNFLMALFVGQNNSRGLLTWTSSLFVNPASLVKRKNERSALTCSKCLSILVGSNMLLKTYCNIIPILNVLTSTSLRNSLYPSDLATSAYEACKTQEMIQ